MKKGKLVIIVFIIVALCLLITKANYKQSKNITVNIKNNNSNFISMMLEDDKGNYIENKDPSFPFDEYMFNAEASGCENGGKLSWNKEKQKVEASLLTSDKCYAYFDKYDFTKSCMLGYEDNLACDIVKKNDETLIYHNGTIKSGDIIIDAQDYSYRFSGASDIVNNYVCLGTNNNATGECDANDLYRIIGLFKNDTGHYEIKLIKSTPYEGTDVESGSNFTASGKGYRWSGSSTNQKNTWKDSALNTDILNKTYIQNLPSYVQVKIVIHTYVTGGNSDAKIYSEYVYNVYQNEIVNPEIGADAQEIDKTSSGKIALMYASDYGYAVDKEAWTIYRLNSYSNIKVTQNNWLYLNDGMTYEWLLLRRSDYSGRAFYVARDGYIDNDYYVYSISQAVRPVFYLDYKTTKKSGEGTLLNPYRLS